jgi:hypothetical protein
MSMLTRSLVAVMVLHSFAGAGADEERAERLVAKLGGAVKRDDKSPGRPVLAVNLSRTRMTGAGLKELAALKQLQVLDLAYPPLTGAGLKELAPFTQLQTLNLSATEVSDAGLKELAALQQLQSLDLSQTKVTDAGLKELAALKQLQSLDLAFTAVTDAGAAQLRKALPRCRIRHLKEPPTQP